MSPIEWQVTWSNRGDTHIHTLSHTRARVHTGLCHCRDRLIYAGLVCTSNQPNKQTLHCALPIPSATKAQPSATNAQPTRNKARRGSPFD